MKILFVCNQNKNISRVAELLFKDRAETKSSGIYATGDKMLNKELLEWADVVCVMENSQREEIGKRFPQLYLMKRIICFDIPDIYNKDVRIESDHLKVILEDAFQGKIVQGIKGFSIADFECIVCEKIIKKPFVIGKYRLICSDKCRVLYEETCKNKMDSCLICHQKLSKEEIICWHIDYKNKQLIPICEPCSAKYEEYCEKTKND